MSVQKLIKFSLKNCPRCLESHPCQQSLYTANFLGAEFKHKLAFRLHINHLIKVLLRMLVILNKMFNKMPLAL